MAPLVATEAVEEQAERGLSAVRARGDRVAYWLSQITTPFVVGIGVLGYVSLSTAPAMTDGLWWLAVVAAGLLVPYGLIWWGVSQGRWTDIHVSRRSQRLVPLLIGLLALGGMLAALLILNASRPLVATLVAILVEFAVAAAMTRVARFKISLHIDAAAGAVTVCCLLAGPTLLALSPLVAVIAWARWKLGAHTRLQLTSGAALAVVVTVTTYWLFGIR